MRQGQSVKTLDKERKIGAAESIGMTIVNGMARHHAWRRSKPYFHLDLNAGSGWNDIAGCPGSPFVFLELAQQKITHLPLYAWFCDINPDTVGKLERLLVRHGHLPQLGVSLICDDNRSVIQRFAEQIRRRERPEYALGSLLCDPNAWFHRNAKGEGVPVQEILEFAAEFPRIDIILNVNYRIYHCHRGAGIKMPNSAHARMLTPEQIRTALGREHWLVSRQHHGPGDSFWLAIGRNCKTGDYTKLGLHHWESEHGRMIMQIVEGFRQGELEVPRPVPLPLFHEHGAIA